MLRKVLTVASLAVIGLWLFFAYGPSTVLPRIAYPSWSLPMLAALSLAGLAGFLAIQTWVLWSTDRALVAARNRELVQEFHLSRWRELFWTALPIVMTVAVALAAAATWAALA